MKTRTIWIESTSNRPIFNWNVVWKFNQLKLILKKYIRLCIYLDGNPNNMCIFDVIASLKLIFQGLRILAIIESQKYDAQVDNCKWGSLRNCKASMCIELSLNSLNFTSINIKRTETTVLKMILSVKNIHFGIVIKAEDHKCNYVKS